MTRFIHNDDLGMPDTKAIELEITKKDQQYTWSYSNKRVIISSFPTPVEIKLRNKTGEPAAFMDNYASTGVSDEYSPISSLELGKGGQSITFMISLYKYQLIDFGVFVVIEQSGGQVILFCDPQASNDPIKTP